MYSSGLNFQDLMARQGAIESLPKAPFILGFECSGVIEQVGEGVEKFKVSYLLYSILYCLGKWLKIKIPLYKIII